MSSVLEDWKKLADIEPNLKELTREVRSLTYLWHYKVENTMQNKEMAIRDRKDCFFVAKIRDGYMEKAAFYADLDK